MATRNIDKELKVPQESTSLTFVVPQNDLADIKDKQPNVDLKRQFAGGESCLKIVKEQEGSREQVDGKSDKHSHTPITQDEQDTELRILEAVTLHENDTASNIDKENTGNNVDDCAYNREQTIINAESKNSGKAVENINEIGNEHVEKCIETESDEGLAEIIDQSSAGQSGLPCGLELTGVSEYGSDYLENEIVSPIKKLNENDAVKDSTCEETSEEKIDAEVRKSEEKVIDADSKSEMDRLNACCQNGENDEVEGEKRADGKDDPAKAERFINSFVRRVKVAYKIYRGCTENFFFQTVFVLTIVFQRNNPEFFHLGNPILNQFYAEMNQTPHNGFQENSVFTVLENSSAPEAISIFLPEPNLPRTTDIMNIVNANTLGITLRPDFENTANTGSSDTSQLRVDSSQCIQHTGTSSGGHQSNVEVLRSSQFINISSSPLTATVREGENDSQVQRCTRTNDIPALPFTDELALDEANTNRKITEPVRDNLINRGQSRQSVDGSPSSATTNLRDRNIPTVGNSLERIPEYASHLSNSVSEQPSQQISDDMVFGEEQMTNILARARTFDDRWPHRHLNPGDMARAGFFFTGEEDMTRCFDCDIGLGKWEMDDNPFTEHRRLSPMCKYIKSLCQNNPQLFGASGQDGRTGNSNLAGTGDAASGGQQNDIQGLGHRRTIYRQMERQEREDPEFLFPHGEHGDDDDSTIYSELLQAQSCESEHTGIQESGSNTGLTMFAVTENSRTLQDSPNLDSANVNELIGTDQTFDAIDYNMDFYRHSQEVRMVLSEGYSQREVDIAVESLLNEDGIITVDALKYKLQYLGFTQKH